MKDLVRRSQYLLSETHPEALRPSTSEVAFVGRSNVGKSSLLNALCEHKGLADVSKMPGRTRMIAAGKETPRVRAEDPPRLHDPLGPGLPGRRPHRRAPVAGRVGRLDVKHVAAGRQWAREQV